MFCKCNIVEFDGEQLQKNLGRIWDLGPVVVSKEPGSNFLSIIGTNDVFNKSFVTISEFKQAILQDPVFKPLIIKFSVEGNNDSYGFGVPDFDEQVLCKYIETVYKSNCIELKFELLAKGKELGIFNVNSVENKRAGDKKPLFWASLF